MAAKRRVSRNNRNKAFQVLQVDIGMVLSTLADNTALALAMTALADDFWFVSGDLTWVLRGGSAGEGPIHVGIANGDLSVAEIKEAITASPVSRSDIVEREEAGRPVRKVGSFPGLSTNEALNDGKPIRTKISMYLAEEKELVAYAFNSSGGALTGGQVIEVYGSLYGVWK